MLIHLPALIKDQELDMVNWRRIRKHGLKAVKIRIRIERKWDKIKVEHVLPDGILPPGSPRRKLIMTNYPKGAMECKMLYPLDSNNPLAIETLLKFISKKYPNNSWYVMDIWFLNDKDDVRFKGALLEFHLTTIMADPKLGNIKGLRLNKINDEEILDVDATADELRNADNGYADDVCIIKNGKPKVDAKYVPMCGLV
jgi:hypothetical protein